MKEINFDYGPTGTTIYKNSEGYWHRIGLSAVIWYDGENNWNFNGELHRLNGYSYLDSNIQFNDYKRDDYEECFTMYGKYIEINIGKLVI